jgi:4-hydroxybenzoate polyprenyltransferase
MIGAVYRAFMRFTRWYGRLVTSVAAGFMAAMALCLVGGRLAGSREWATTVLFMLAVPLWIAVSVFAYKALKPQPEQE